MAHMYNIFKYQSKISNLYSYLPMYAKIYLYLYWYQKWYLNKFVFAKKKIYLKIFFHLPKKLTLLDLYLYFGLKIVFFTQCKSLEVSYKLLQCRKVKFNLNQFFLVFGLYMYLVSRSANQSDKKNNFKLFQRGGGG